MLREAGSTCHEAPCKLLLLSKVLSVDYTLKRLSFFCSVGIDPFPASGIRVCKLYVIVKTIWMFRLNVNKELVRSRIIVMVRYTILRWSFVKWHLSTYFSVRVMVERVRCVLPISDYLDPIWSTQRSCVNTLTAVTKRVLLVTSHKD